MLDFDFGVAGFRFGLMGYLFVLLVLGRVWGDLFWFAAVDDLNGVGNVDAFFLFSFVFFGLLVICFVLICY